MNNRNKNSYKDRVIVQSVVLNVSMEEAFTYFTNNQRIEEWLTTKADVLPEVGGKYELFWNPETPEDNSTIRCKVLAIHAPHYIMFDWKGPVQFKSFMNSADPLTTVMVNFSSLEEKTLVTLIHSGWRNQSNWEEARNYFVNAWKGALQNLEKITNN
ncbi:MAG: SRPBCC domain-containing protein [Balneolaceae bacterium]